MPHNYLKGSEPQSFGPIKNSTVQPSGLSKLLSHLIIKAETVVRRKATVFDAKIPGPIEPKSAKCAFSFPKINRCIFRIDDGQL